MGFESIEVPDLPVPGQFSHVVKNGNLVFISGQTEVELGRADVDDGMSQARRIFDYLVQAVKAAGGQMDDIVKLNIYLTDRRYFAAIRELRPQYFRSPYPAATTVVVDGLVNEVAGIEIEAIAVLD